MSLQGCLRTMHVRHRGYSSVPTFCVRSRRSGPSGYRYVLRALVRDALSFVWPSFSPIAQELTAVVWMHGRVAITMKDNGRDRLPITQDYLVIGRATLFHSGKR